MSDNIKGINSLDLNTRIVELQNINILHNEFGDIAYNGISKCRI